MKKLRSEWIYGINYEYTSAGKLGSETSNEFEITNCKKIILNCVKRWNHVVLGIWIN